MLSGADYQILPALALACNIIVVTGGTARFARAGHVRLKALAPFIVFSAPAAWIGGRLPVSETVFVGLLGGALLLTGLRLLFQHDRLGAHKTIPLWGAAAMGSAIGLLSGLVGIGGGIFLAPVLYFCRWGTAREIAAAASVFILVNSVTGLTGQMMKLNDISMIGEALAYWPLLPAVLIGGQIGSYFASTAFKPVWIERLTALLILIASIRLLWRWVEMIWV